MTTRASEDWLEGDAVNNGGYGGARPTFAQLQQSGIPRPPAPAYSAATKAATPTAESAVPVSQARYSPHIITTTEADRPAPSEPYYDPHILTHNGGTDGEGGGTGTGGTGTTTDPNAGESPFEKALRERYQSSPNAPQFTSGAHAQTAAQFVPGANPFTGSFEGVTAPTFKGASPITTPFEGVNAPTPYQPGQFSGQNATKQQLDPAILKSVMDMLANPSAYTTDVAKSTYDRLGGAIDDQYNVDNQHINEDMARRGLSVSTIGAGRLADSSVARKSAKEDLAGRILTDQASTLGADRARAIAAAQGLTDDQFNQLLAEYQTNATAGQQGFANRMSTAGFAQSEAARKAAEGIATGTFNEGLAKDQFAGDTTSANFQQSEAARKVAQALNTGTFNEGLASDKYNADQTGRAFNSAEDQRGFNDALSSFSANRTSDAQGFGEQEQKLKDYLGFGQQGFDNSLATQQANNQQNQELIALLTQLFGGTGGGGTA